MNRFTTSTTVAVLLLFPAMPTMAQTNLTVAGGVNRATVNVEGVGLIPGQEWVNRLAIGASIGIPLLERLGLHLGAGYSQKGFALSVFGVETTTEVDYLEITALAGVPIPVGERASVHLLAGPALAFKLSCQLSVTFMGDSGTEDCGEDGPNAMDLGLMGGARLVIGVSEKLGLSLDALYNHGLLDMDDIDSEVIFKNRVMTLQAGIVYSIG